MAKKTVKTPKKVKRIYVVGGSDYCIDEKDLKDSLDAGDFADGDIIEIYELVGTKKVKESSYRLED